MRPFTRTIIAGTAAALMGGTALAQQVILVPGPDGQGSGSASGQEQRFILVPAPRFAPGQDAQAGADSSMAMELYRRGYQQGVSDAERAGAARQQIDPGAIERIGRELFERGYVLGMMQAQLQAGQQQGGQGADQADATKQGAAQGSQQAQPGQQGGQQATGQQDNQQAAGQQAGQQQTTGQQGGQQQATGQQGGQQQATGQQGGQQSGQQLVQSQAGTGQADMPDATIGTKQSQQHGQYLVDDDGRAVYMFTADKQGQGDAQKAVSNCQDDCAAAWPPVLSQSDSAGAMGAAKPELIGTIERQDGTTQVTYDGWPLYYYVEDQGQAQATGQDVHSFGGEWYLMTPDGQKVGEG